MPKKRHVEDSDGEETSPVVKKAKVKSSGAAVASKKGDAPTKGKDSEGNAYWEIGNKRRIGTSTFKGASLINIREYYEANGELRPGKKGISLSLDQYRALVKIIPQLNEELRAAGHDIEDPAAAGPGSVDGGASLVAADLPKKAKKKAKKANIDVTSDEEDEEDEEDSD
ncbi:RNA polymerase [Echria macrotheca]|uniref:RNA polymerase n=1 Tax=Echria macrotheca TaxID=438768 RepID=A0AAJ0B1J2_9PEZI|nr:RNA polymerase [Echria macrotheca]